MIHHWLKIVKQKIRAYWPIVAFTVPLGGRPRGPKNWAIIGTKKHAIKVAKKMQALLQKMQEQLHNHDAIYVDIASSVANSVQAKLQ